MVNYINPYSDRRYGGVLSATQGMLNAFMDNQKMRYQMQRDAVQDQYRQSVMRQHERSAEQFELGRPRKLFEYSVYSKLNRGEPLTEEERYFAKGGTTIQNIIPHTVEQLRGEAYTYLIGGIDEKQGLVTHEKYKEAKSKFMSIYGDYPNAETMFDSEAAAGLGRDRDIKVQMKPVEPPEPNWLSRKWKALFSSEEPARPVYGPKTEEEQNKINYNESVKPEREHEWGLTAEGEEPITEANLFSRRGLGEAWTGVKSLFTGSHKYQGAGQGPVNMPQMVRGISAPVPYDPRSKPQPGMDYQAPPAPKDAIEKEAHAKLIKVWFSLPSNIQYEIWEAIEDGHKLTAIVDDEVIKEFLK
jgi:hypothetical protein